MTIKGAITQLKDLKRDRESFFNNDGDDEVFCTDAEACKIAIEALEKQIPNTDSKKISSLESENAALRQLLKLAVGDIEDIHENTEDDYVCSKCTSFDVYTFCKRHWSGGVNSNGGIQTKLKSC